MRDRMAGPRSHGRGGARLLALLAYIIRLDVRCAAQKPGHASHNVDRRFVLESLSPGEGELLRPGYHITAERNWMNDPNGPFEHNNVTHIFYQWNPDANKWGPPSWGHVISRDLVTWKRLPAALLPDHAYDRSGAFSGSAALLPNGTTMLLYTGAVLCPDAEAMACVAPHEKPKFYFQTQAAALPVDGRDPELKLWRKYAANPLAFEVPREGTHLQFRDPMTPFWQNGRHWTAIGGQVDCIGAAILYSSNDLLEWQLHGHLANQIGVGQTDGNCTDLPPTHSCGLGRGDVCGDRGRCDPMGPTCRTWECPDYFVLPGGIHVLKWSDQVNGRVPFAVDWYTLSNTEPDLENASSPSAGGAFINEIDGATVEPEAFDYGAVYASKTWQASDGRRLWVGWVYETAVGCTQQCSGGSAFTDQMGWQGVLTVPRVVEYDAASKTLLLNPIPELVKLRTRKLIEGRVDLANATLSDKAHTVTKSPGLPQFDLNVSFGGLEGEGAFAVGIVVGFGRICRTVISINGSMSRQLIQKADVSVECSGCRRITETAVDGGRIPLPEGGLPLSELRLRVLVDRSLVEVFALQGRARVAARVYVSTASQSDWSLGLFATGPPGSLATAHESCWVMKRCWVD